MFGSEFACQNEKQGKGEMAIFVTSNVTTILSSRLRDYKANIRVVVAMEHLDLITESDFISNDLTCEFLTKRKKKCDIHSIFKHFPT